MVYRKRLTNETIMAPTKNPVKALPQKYPMEVVAMRRNPMRRFAIINLAR